MSLEVFGDEGAFDQIDTASMERRYSVSPDGSIARKLIDGEDAEWMPIEDAWTEHLDWLLEDY